MVGCVGKMYVLMNKNGASRLLNIGEWCEYSLDGADVHIVWLVVGSKKSQMGLSLLYNSIYILIHLFQNGFINHRWKDTICVVCTRWHTMVVDGCVCYLWCFQKESYDARVCNRDIHEQTFHLLYQHRAFPMREA